MADESRDFIAETLGSIFSFIGNAVSWVFGNPSSGLIAVGVVAGLAVLWRLSLMVVPSRICPRCQGESYLESVFGVRECPRCGAKGVIPRLGSGGKR